MNQNKIRKILRRLTKSFADSRWVGQIKTLPYNYQVRGTASLGQGSKLQTDSDRCIYVQNGSARGQVRDEFQRDTHSIRP